MPASTPASDLFASHAPTAFGPARTASLVTPADGADLGVFAKALRVFNPGTGPATLRITYAGDDSGGVVDLTVPAGLTVEPSSVRRVWATGTTASLVIHAYTS